MITACVRCLIVLCADLIHSGPCSIPSEFSTIYNGDLHQYSPDERKWTEVTAAWSAPAPPGRCGMGFAASAGRLLIFGGCTSTRECLGCLLYQTAMLRSLPLSESVPLLTLGLPAVQNDLWAAYPPTSLSWPAEAGADFFINVYDWDTLELLPGYGSELPLSIALCSGFFPCRISLHGSTGSYLSRGASGSISCQVRLGCGGITVMFRVSKRSAVFIL